jgi:hypothetical protein
MEKGSAYQEIKKMTKEGQLKQTKIGDSIDFSEIYRVKGVKGLYTLGSKVNQAGMLKMVRFLTGGKGIIVHKRSLVNLGSIVFHTELGVKSLRINQVFNNLVDFYGSDEWKADNSLTPKLSDFVPNYDPTMFKEHNALNILLWFNEIVTKITDLDVKIKDKKED